MKRGEEISIPREGRPLLRDQLITLKDLYDFKEELLAEIRNLLAPKDSSQQKKWLKSYEVKELLHLSHGTLQALRNNGTLPFTRIGGIIYYDAADINKMLASNKQDRSSKR